MKCIICQSTSIAFFLKIYDDRFGWPGLFQIYLCDGCRHKFIEGDFSPEMLMALYANYECRSELDVEKHWIHKEVRGFHAWLDGERSFAFRWVPREVSVLDIGCGMGHTLGYHINRGCDSYGVEADANILRFAERFGYKVHVGLFEPALYEESFFDYVTMDQVMEHVANPIDTLRGIARILKPGGRLIVSVPNSNGWGARILGKKWINWHAPYHIQHFSPESMNIAAEKAGLKVEEWRTITCSEWLNYQWLHLLTYPKEGQPSAFWAAHGELTRMQKLFYTLIFMVKKTKINHLVTRFFDGLHLGDNFIFILRKAA